MKKVWLTLSLAFMAATSAFADNAILGKIETQCNSVTSIVSDFDQVKTIAANGKQIASDGVLYYTADKFAMHYTDAAKEMLIINGNDFFMIRNGRKALFNTEKNKPMQSLSNTLLMCMSGDLQQLADQNNADITATDKGSFYEVILTARQKSVKGYATIVLNYDKTTGLLTKMVMNEFNGNSTSYALSGIKKNVEIEAGKFEISR